MEMGEILLAYHVGYRELARIVRHDVFVEKELAFFCKIEECIEDRLCAALGRGNRLDPKRNCSFLQLQL